MDYKKLFRILSISFILIAIFLFKNCVEINGNIDQGYDCIGDECNTTSLKFAVYGDTRTSASVHKTICNHLNLENPALILHSGDLWDGYSSAIWKSHFTSLPNLNNLLKSNKILIAKGNHEVSTSVVNFSPSIVKNNSTSYSFSTGNVFFVCLGEFPSASYLTSQLNTTEAKSAAFRIIFHHVPIYSSGEHGASGNSGIEAVCDKYNVTMSFAGHDHIYERTAVMYGGKAVYSGMNVPADVKGTTYVVTGGGGAPLYSFTKNSWTDYIVSKQHYCILTSSNDKLEMTVKDINGSVIEKFVRNKFL